jgi:hypothetical protein
MEDVEALEFAAPLVGCVLDGLQLHTVGSYVIKPSVGADSLDTERYDVGEAVTAVAQARTPNGCTQPAATSWSSHTCPAWIIRARPPCLHRRRVLTCRPQRPDADQRGSRRPRSVPARGDHSIGGHGGPASGCRAGASGGSRWTGAAALRPGRPGPWCGRQRGAARAGTDRAVAVLGIRRRCGRRFAEAIMCWSR